MSRGRGAHYVPRVKDSNKREVAFSLVSSNLGKKGKVCYLNGTEFRENGKMMVDAVWLEGASGKTVAEAMIIKCDATRMDLRFDGEIAAGPYQIVGACAPFYVFDRDAEKLYYHFDQLMCQVRQSAPNRDFPD